MTKSEFEAKLNAAVGGTAYGDEMKKYCYAEIYFLFIIIHRANDCRRQAVENK